MVSAGTGEVLAFNTVLNTLGDVFREDVLRVVEIAAESVVVHFSSGAQVTITANEQIVILFARGHKAERLEYAEELLGSYMQRLGTIEILECGLKQDAVSLDQTDHTVDLTNQAIFLKVAEIGAGLRGKDNSLFVCTFVTEDTVDVLTKSIVINEVSDTGLIFVNKRVNLILSKLDLKSAEASAEGSIAASALAKFVEVNEELANADSVFGDEGL